MGKKQSKKGARELGGGVQRKEGGGVEERSSQK